MAELTDAQIDAALEHGRVVVELTNGCTFPARLAQKLETATDEQLGRAEIMEAGYGLHWEALDADLSVPGLLAGLFGTEAHVAQLAGQAKFPAKAAAARADRTKGGRLRKPAPG